MNRKIAKPAHIFKGRDDQWYWHIRARNGRVVVQSEGYRSKAGAKKGITALARVLETEIPINDT